MLSHLSLALFPRQMLTYGRRIPLTELDYRIQVLTVHCNFSPAMLRPRKCMEICFHISAHISSPAHDTSLSLSCSVLLKDSQWFPAQCFSGAEHLFCSLTDKLQTRFQFVEVADVKLTSVCLACVVAWSLACISVGGCDNRYSQLLCVSSRCRDTDLCPPECLNWNIGLSYGL